MNKSSLLLGAATINYPTWGHLYRKKKLSQIFLEDRKFKMETPTGLWLVMDRSLHPIEGKNAMPSSTRQEVGRQKEAKRPNSPGQTLS